MLFINDPLRWLSGHIPLKHGMSISEEVKNVAQRTGFCFIPLRVVTSEAGQDGELPVLDVEEFGKTSAGRLHLIRFEGTVSVFGTLPVTVLHIFPAFAVKVATAQLICTQQILYVLINNV